MSNSRSWSRAIVLSFILAAVPSTVVAQEKSENPLRQRSWLDRVRGRNPMVTESPAEDDATVTSATQSRALGQAMTIRAREEAALHRRQKVCLRLMELALQLQDKRLEKRAQQLEERAWQIYLQRTSHLAISRQLEGSDEQRLTQQLSGDDDDAADQLLRKSKGEQKESSRQRRAFFGFLRGGKQ